MRKRKGKSSASILALLALVAFTLTFQLGAAGALAQDADYDGFTDSIETSGILLPAGLHLAAYPQEISLPKCVTGIPRDKCVDPTTQDLFVIIQRATGGCPASTCGDPCLPMFDNDNNGIYESNIPLPTRYSYANTYNPLALVPGLGVTTHELIQSPSYTSQAIGGWYAVKIIENLDPCSNYMGLATFGVPYSGSVATVWPEKIKNWIAKACSEACFTDRYGATSCYHPNDPGVTTFYCKNANSTTIVNMRNPDPNLVRKLNGEFIQNVINHEVSHMMYLASGSGTSADHHWPIAYGCLMEQFIGTKVTKDTKGNINVILYISTGYTKQDKTQHLLK